MMTLNKTRRRGFTLLELMGVLLILAVLISLLLPAVQQAREAARRTQCRNNMFQLGVAFANYQMTHSVLPPGCISRPGYEGRIEETYRISWVAQLLPFFEHKGFHQQVNFNNPELSFLRTEEIQRHQKVMGLWIELRTLQGLPLSPVPTDPMTGAPLAESPPQAASDVTTPSDVPPVSETPSTTDSDAPNAETAAGGLQTAAGELQRASRIMELELELSNLGHSNLNEVPVISSQMSNAASAVLPIDMLHCPTRPTQGVCYSGSHNSTSSPISADADGLLYLDSSESLRTIPDGTASTILAGENATAGFQPADWLFGNKSTLRNGGSMSTDTERARAANPNGLVSDFSGMSPEARQELINGNSQLLGPFGSYHSFEKVNFLFADGSVRSLSSKIDVTTLGHMINRHDGF